MADDTEVKNAVCLTKPCLKEIGRIFELNPHLAPWALISVLWECFEWSRKGPEQPERHYWSRMGTDLGTFCRKLNLIVQELGTAEECPVRQSQPELPIVHTGPDSDNAQHRNDSLRTVARRPQPGTYRLRT
jgi:hypothetical protein